MAIPCPLAVFLSRYARKPYEFVLGLIKNQNEGLSILSSQELLEGLNDLVDPIVVVNEEVTQGNLYYTVSASAVTASVFISDNQEPWAHKGEV